MRDIALYLGREELLKELEALKCKSSELFLQLEYMMNEEEPTLSFIYIYETGLGSLELNWSMLELQIAIINFEISLRQLAINLGKLADEIAIHKAVQAEKEKYQTVIEEKRLALEVAKKSAGSAKSSCNARASDELKDLYRKIAKALHPDINPHVSKKGKQLFIKATDAYRNNDLNALRQIFMELKDGNIIDDSEDCRDNVAELSEIELIAQIAKLKKSIKDFENRIAFLNTQFPFIYRDKLNDKDWIKKRRIELKGKIAVAKKRIEELNNYLNILRTCQKT